MAPKPHVELATRWLERSQQRERRDEVEYRFRTWLQRQVVRGHARDVAAATLGAAIAKQPHGHWRYSRELLDELGELDAPGEERLPDETPEERSRRKARTAAFLGPRGVSVPNAVEDELAAEAERTNERLGAEAEQEDRGRLSEGERAELDGLRG